jgi:hypothetical protein
VEFFASTPGRLALITIVLVAAVLAAAVTVSTTIGDRRGRLKTLCSHTEPLADAAQRIYGPLSVANTAATTGFLPVASNLKTFAIATMRRSARRRPASSPRRTVWRPTTFARSPC